MAEQEITKLELVAFIVSLIASPFFILNIILRFLNNYVFDVKNTTISAICVILFFVTFAFLIALITILVINKRNKNRAIQKTENM